MGQSDFRVDLEELLNSNNKENGSDTPDYVLAQFLIASLASFDLAVRLRDQYYGEDRTSQNRID